MIHHLIELPNGKQTHVTCWNSGGKYVFKTGDVVPPLGGKSTYAIRISRIWKNGRDTGGGSINIENLTIMSFTDLPPDDRPQFDTFGNTLH